jgi:hypothetical protein|nr:hypothetical protein [Klebsiella pneumoniae]
MAYGYAVHILFSHLSIADPKNTKTGSALFQPEVTSLAIQLYFGIVPY